MSPGDKSVLYSLYIVSKSVIYTLQTVKILEKACNLLLAPGDINCGQKIIQNAPNLRLCGCALHLACSADRALRVPGRTGLRRPEGLLLGLDLAGGGTSSLH